MSTIELNEKARVYFDLLDEIDRLTAEAEAIKDSVKSVMVDMATEELDGDGWRATWHNINTARFDAKRFKTDHSDLYAAYTIRATGVRFTMNRVRA